ncbi:MAG: hypothetical protein VX346_08340 [Planctomycetota bacterium]|nr:hypothetical protein [Planctomycetota bacterium]
MINPYAPPAELNQPPEPEQAQGLFKPPQWALAAASYNVFISGLWIFLGLFYLLVVIRVVAPPAGTINSWTSSVMAGLCLTLGGLSTVVTVGVYTLASWTQPWCITYCVSVFSLATLALLGPQLGVFANPVVGVCCAPVLFFLHPITLLGVVFSHRRRRAFFNASIDESHNKQTLDQLEQLGGRLLTDNDGQVFAAYFNNTAIRDADLAYLTVVTGLTHLILTGTAVSDTGLAQLHSLGQLKIVDLTETRVSAAGVQSLRTALPRATIYHHLSAPTAVHK